MKAIHAGALCLGETETRFLKRNRVSRNRRGFTLMEMVVVITAMTAVSVTGALLVGLLMSAESQGARAIVRQQTIARLARQLRSDAHAATASALVAAEARPDGALVLSQPDSTEVRWTAAADSVVREVGSAASMTQHETFQLPDGESRFRFDEAAGLIEFVHEAARDPLADSYSANAPAGVPQSWRVEAAIGNGQNRLDEPQN